MRTKTFLITAALSVAAATSWAQVYSVNAVGYVNVTIPVNGPFALIANPLNGTNNSVNTILPIPDDNIGTTLYRWDAASQGFAAEIPTYLGTGVGWIPEVTIAPGEGFFALALSGSGAPLSITFVGEVPQGQLVNPLAGNGKYSFRSSIVPQAAALGSTGTAGTLEFPAAIGDLVYTYDPTTGYVGPWTYLGPGLEWLDAGGNPGNGPVIPVANGFVVQQVGGTATEWTRNFSVNN